MDPSLLIIIVFILAPLIERLLKAGKQQEPPELPRQRPRPRMEAPREQHRQEHEEARTRVVVRREEEEAATMLPDDLWEILTGEKRTPAPAPTRYEPEEAEPEAFEEDIDAEEARSLETTSAGEWISVPPEPEPAPPTVPAPGSTPVPVGRRPSAWSDYQSQRRAQAPVEHSPIRIEEGYIRPIPRHEPPRIVSLEDLDIDDDARHDRFHEKLEASRRRAPVRTPSAWRFTSDDDLRKAIVMAEVLGKPRGLEDM